MQAQSLLLGEIHFCFYFVTQPPEFMELLLVADLGIVVHGFTAMCSLSPRCEFLLGVHGFQRSLSAQ